MNDELLALAERLSKFLAVLESARRCENKAISVWSDDVEIVSKSVSALRLAAASPGDVSMMRKALVEARQRLALFARPDSEYEKPTFDLIDAALEAKDAEIAVKEQAIADLARQVHSSSIGGCRMKASPMTTRDDLVSNLRLAVELMPHITSAAIALEARDAEIARLTADRNQMMKQVAELGRQLAAETERCACIAQDNRQHSNQIVMRTLEAESAYEEACDDIAAAIRGGASEDDGD